MDTYIDLKKYAWDGSNFDKFLNEKYVKIGVGILDTAGQEEFSALQDQWIREGQIFLLCFSVVDYESFQLTTNYYEKILEGNDFDGTESTCNFSVVLIGTKSDLRGINCNDGKLKSDKKKEVPMDEIIKKSKEWNVPYIETSSLFGRNVNFAFRQAIHEHFYQTKLGNCVKPNVSFPKVLGDNL